MLRDRCDDSTRGEKEIRLEKLKEVREADLYPDNFYIISEMPWISCPSALKEYRRYLTSLVKKQKQKQNLTTQSLSNKKRISMKEINERFNRVRYLLGKYYRWIMNYDWQG